ncbi:septum formation initiator family protein [bacterium]|nr:septum formation initiator family protein [bacterium]
MGKIKAENLNNYEEKRKNRKSGFYYSFLTIVLVFCLIQIGYGAILNIGKIVSYKAKVITLERVLKQTKLHNQDLKAEKKMVTSDNSLEGIARNNLKMAKQDEVLIIINKKVEKPVKKDKKFKLGDIFKLKQNSQDDELNSIPYIPQTMEEE